MDPRIYDFHNKISSTFNFHFWNFSSESEDFFLDTEDTFGPVIILDSDIQVSYHKMVSDDLWSLDHLLHFVCLRTNVGLVLGIEVWVEDSLVLRCFPLVLDQD